DVRVRGRAAVAVFLLAAGVGAADWLLKPAIKVLDWFKPWELPWGLPRFLLTPLPWRLVEQNEFLFLPSALHLLFILPALAVIPLLWARGGAARLLLIHGALVVLLY